MTPGAIRAKHLLDVVRRGPKFIEVLVKQPVAIVQEELQPGQLANILMVAPVPYLNGSHSHPAAFDKA